MIIKSKKVVALLCAAAITTSVQGMMFAEYDPNKVVDPTSEVMTTKAIEAPIFVNDQMISGTYFTEGEHTMLPIRAVAEALGMTVTWNDEAKRVELTREGAPLYVTFAIGNDGYTFARTAPLQLGVAPVIVNDRTFVPLTLITDIMGGYADFEGDALYIAYGDAASETLIGSATIISIDEEEILVYDTELGEVRLGIHEELVINDENGEAITVSDLSEGMNVIVAYSPQMGQSLPPFNAPISITVEAVDEYATVTVTEKGEDFILVNDAKFGDVILFAGEETVITDEAGEKLTLADIAEGATLLVKYGPAMTASIPAKNTPEEIIVTAAASAVEVIGTVTEADENGILVSWTGGVYEELYLNVSDETVLTKADGTKATLADFTEGTCISASASTMMTRSLPPQSAAFSVTITK